MTETTSYQATPDAVTPSETLPQPRDFTDLVEMVESMIPEESSESATFQSVMLLRAAQRTGQNVDRIAGFARLDRNFVARCVRRLVDNGVWGGGAAPPPRYVDSVDVLTDAAVARGELCRYGEGSEEERWVAPGAWRHHFEERAIMDALICSVGGSTVEEVDEPTPARVEASFLWDSTLRFGMGRWNGDPASPSGASTRVAVSRHPAGGVELFPGACWLG